MLWAEHKPLRASGWEILAGENAAKDCVAAVAVAINLGSRKGKAQAGLEVLSGAFGRKEEGEVTGLFKQLQ